MRIRKANADPLSISEWTLAKGEFLVVYGGNASGKSALAALIAGDWLPSGCERIDAPRSVAWVSFENSQARYERELENDESNFLDRIDYGSSGRTLLAESGATPSQIEAIAQRFSLDSLLDRGCRQFSSGEWRRIEIAQALLAEPELIILDEPYEGMDPESSQQLEIALKTLAQSGQWLVLFVNRHDDIPPWAQKLTLLVNGCIIAEGEPQDILASSVCQQLFRRDASRDLPLPEAETSYQRSDPLLFCISEGHVRYGDTYQFKDLDWTLNRGEHTLVRGPNGSGKSTLLGLITGDHPQCYANDIRIFGYQRGTGESIWAIKENIGIVSPALHRDYRAGGSTLSVALSGFFDSIGLYHDTTRRQIHIATQWLAVLGMEPLANTPFRQLSYGQQRLALIARGLVKQPPLLILDEPTQGLDDLNRSLVLSYLERLVALKQTTLLFVSHRQDEHLPLFRRQLQFVPSKKLDVRFEVINAIR